MRIIRKKSKATRTCTRNAILNLASCKRSQEEIIGFVLIVVLVVIVGVILLGLALRKSSPSQNSVELSNFLEASMLTTTSCAINFVPNYESLQDLILACWNNEKCLNDKPACEMLNKTAAELLDKSFPINSGRYSGYKINIFYAINETESRQDILSLDKGNCSSGAGGEKIIPASPGNIITRLEVCYQE